MLSGGKRVAYTRLTAEDILYSKVDSEKGRNCGRVQTIFLRVCVNSFLNFFDGLKLIQGLSEMF